EVDAFGPERAAREGIELCAGGAFGEFRRGNGDVALQDLREARAHFAARLADGNGARHVRGPVLVLRAGIEQEQFARRDAAIALLRHAIVDDGAVRARAGDGREGNVFQLARFTPEGFERGDGVDLGQVAL